MKVGIICRLDGTSNSVRPEEIKKFLGVRGHDVTLLDTHDASFFTPWFYRGKRLREISRRKKTSIPELMEMRASALEKRLKRNGFDAVICETSLDSYVLTKKLGCLTIYDCPTPFADEMLYSAQLSERELEQLRSMELETYKAVDFLTFYWETYVNYVKRNIYDGSNMFVMNYGCHPSNKRVEFSQPPRIAYMGHLGGYWMNWDLLVHLASLTRDIDMYGTPDPGDTEGVNYKGYASPEVLADYQFGLITISRDELRCEGFSAKHIEYISHGLPVLIPNWRRHIELIGGSIPYDENDFPEQLKRYSNESEWQLKSDEAYEQARKLDWNNTLQVLEKIIA